MPEGLAIIQTRPAEKWKKKLNFYENLRYENLILFILGVSFIHKKV
jgi:hypothetical protein